MEEQGKQTVVEKKQRRQGRRQGWPRWTAATGTGAVSTATECAWVGYEQYGFRTAGTAAET